MAEYLSGESYVCEFADRLHQAMDKIEVYHYDCILLDLMLPDGSGMKILEYLRAQNQQEGVIILSAKEALDVKINGLKLGAADYFTKPFSRIEINSKKK